MGRFAQTPNAVWSDGIHFVRPASERDPHPMRWVVGAHTKAGSLYKHHFATLDEALLGAADATKRHLKAVPQAAAHFKESPLPAASSLQLPKRGKRGRPPKHPRPEAPAAVGYKPEPFATTHFNCCYANPYAQVWICTRDSLEMKGPVGRPRADGRPAEQTPIRHQHNECSVMIGHEVVREPDGRVMIFTQWARAAEYAYELYLTAPEDEVISWKEGDYVVGRTRFCEIRFEPGHSEARPFTLFMPDLGPSGRYVWKDTTRPMHFADTGRLSKTLDTNPQAYLEEQERRRERARASRIDAFAEIPLTFRSIWEAEKEAYRRDQMRLGVVVS